VNGRFVWSDLFLSASGRLARTPFWIATAILIAFAATYEAWVGATLHWLTGWLVYPGLLYCGACVLSKRLHDRGRSGWWAALVLFALIATWPTPHGFGALLFSLILVWAAIELGVMQGEDGANRFGPSPLAQAA
jgi:uncharacterized membrane protein YhaH (DUF805 family)